MIDNIKQGTFYGVSVGPGDPELMTLKAVKTLEQVSVIATPRTGGTQTLALDIAKQVVNLENKTILPLDFLMTRDKLKQQSRHHEIKESIAAHLRFGEDVAMLNLGDASLYSTVSYMVELLKEDGFSIEIVAGVTSFCAVAATLQTSLTTMSKPLHILPSHCLDDVLPLDGTKVVMKTGKAMGELKQMLLQQEPRFKVQAVQNCGLANEKICKTAEDIDSDASYFTTLIIQ